MNLVGCHKCKDRTAGKPAKRGDIKQLSSLVVDMFQSQLH